MVITPTVGKIQRPDHSLALIQAPALALDQGHTQDQDLTQAPPSTLRARKIS